MPSRLAGALRSFLLRVGEKRPHQIMQSTIVPRQAASLSWMAYALPAQFAEDSWKAARSRNTEVRQGLYRQGTGMRVIIVALQLAGCAMSGLAVGRRIRFSSSGSCHLG